MGRRWIESVRRMGACIALVGLAGGLAAGVEGQKRADFGLTTGTILTWYPAPRLALCGDADGDGRADFLGVFQPDGVVDFARMTTIGKLSPNAQARTGLGHDALAAACGRFTGGRGVDVFVLFPDGSAQVAWGMLPRTRGSEATYAHAELAAQLTPDQRPQAPVLSAVGDFDGDGKPDIFLAGKDGKLLCFRNRTGSDHHPHFEALPLYAPLKDLRRLSAGDLAGKGRAEIVWSVANGQVFRAGLTFSPDSRVTLAGVKPVFKGDPDDGLCVGRFRGAREADILVGPRLLPGGVAAHLLPMPNIPGATKAKGDYVWLAADFDGNGMDDLIRAQRNGERFDGDHVYIHYACFGDPVQNAPFADTDNDGLLNGWETGKIKPAGVDLPALGCSPRHKDAIVEIQRIADTDEAAIKSGMQSAVAQFANLPITNLDGVKGIALHPLYDETLPITENGKDWRDIYERHYNKAHIGVTHWMLLTNGGGGQSDELANRGSAGRYGMPTTFVHEFGHQLGLDHTGFWSPAWCPTFRSVMNYAYNYRIDGNGENYPYSDGRLAALVLNERHLSEKLPLPMEKLTFLAGPPYFFRMKPAADGKSTLIDWNWNGIFGEEDVAADINYGYSTTGGTRYTIGKTYAAPAVAAYGEGKEQKLLLFSELLPRDAPVPASSLDTNRHSLTTEEPGRLLCRVWRGEDTRTQGQSWSEEFEVEGAGVTGEASAVWFQGAVWLAYPTTKGVRLRRVTLDNGGIPKFGDSLAVPQSAGAQPTLTPLGGRLALLLWRDEQKPVTLRLWTPDGDSLTPRQEVSLDFTCEAPVGATAGAETPEGNDLWIGLTQAEEGNGVSRWQVRHLRLGKDDLLRPLEKEWVDGAKGGNRGQKRVTLLWEPNAAFGAAGQVYFLQRGGLAKDKISCGYIAMRVADKSVHGGWLTRRYYDEWTNSRSAPAACFFRGDIALAFRWFGNVHGTENDNLFVAFFGRGIEDEPMGDFDEIAYIRDYGLTRSIPLAPE